MQQNYDLTSVLLINYDKRWGGGQEYLIQLIQGLLRHNLSVGQLLAPQSISAERFPALFKQAKNYQYFIFNRLHNIWQLKKVLGEYNIIHIHREHDLWIGLLAKLWYPNTKLVFSQHIKPNRPKLSLLLYDYIICNSIYTKSLLQKAWINHFCKLNSKIQIIYPAASININSVKNHSAELVGEPKILMSGAYWKGKADLLAIFEQVISKIPTAKLYFIAPSTEPTALELLQQSIQAKNLEGKVEVLAPLKRSAYLGLLQKIDILVSTAQTEAFGMAILEATLFNKWVVTYESGGPVEILENYNKGFLISPNNQVAFAKKIVEIAQHKITLVTENLPSFPSNKFSVEQLVEKHLKVYEELIN